MLSFGSAKVRVLFEKCFSFLSTAFLVTQSFTMVEILRNGNLAEMAAAMGEAGGSGHEQFLLKGVEFAKGQPLYRLSMIVGFTLAILCTTFGIFVMPDDAATATMGGISAPKLLMMLATLFTLTAGERLTCEPGRAASYSS